MSALTVSVLRELFRHLRLWESLFESDRVDEVTGPDGITYHLVDVQYLYQCRSLLSPRQGQAIELCLYDGMKERDAAIEMGVSPTNPVAMYATDGMRALLVMADEGMLPRYRTGDRPQQMEEVSA